MMRVIWSELRINSVTDHIHATIIRLLHETRADKNVYKLHLCIKCHTEL